MRNSIIALALVVAIAGLSGCGKVDRMTASWTGYSTQCVNGVNYIQFTSGASVMVDREGKPVPC